MTDYEKEEFWKALNRLYETAVEHTKHVEKDAENIRALVRIADMHDRRLTRLEVLQRAPRDLTEGDP